MFATAKSFFFFVYLSFQNDPNLLFIHTSLAVVSSWYQDIDYSSLIFSTVIIAVNETFINKMTTNVTPTIADIYMEYVRHVRLHNLDMATARNLVQPFLDMVSTKLAMRDGELVYLILAKAKILWVLQDFEKCLKYFRKALSILRKFEANLKVYGLQSSGNIVHSESEVFLLYQIAKGMFY